jgi:Lon protease-like protein
LDPLFEPLQDFSGVARLFPLPNFVLFPYAVAPLHVFEPRYRAMVEDALAGDHLIATALLLPGWEPEYEGRPPVAPVVCLGRIVTHAKLADGRFNLLLAGLHRARVRRELPPDRLFRQAKVELLSDEENFADAAQLLQRREALREYVHRRLPAAAAVREQFEQLMSRPLPLGVLVDVISHAVPLPPEVKQRLLEELNVERRSEILLQHLRNLEGHAPPPDAASPGVWPVRFSDN